MSVQVINSAGNVLWTTDKAEIEAEALRWALQRGSRSGRVAWQFARDYAGKYAGKHTV